MLINISAETRSGAMSAVRGGGGAPPPGGPPPPRGGARGGGAGGAGRGRGGGLRPRRGAAVHGSFGADVVEHGERVACRGPVGERQTLVPGAAVAAGIPRDDPEFRCQRGHLSREHGPVHEEFVC
ncbi:hypothetical protein [Nocardia brasiliensis]|uniref:hypothetical protein n=1 Tax=Nocardia brasiliensis TaxID=37326 RepID=UPI0024583AC1|nr:hypothetical protein [Nocardia brasiliensis]